MMGWYPARETAARTGSPTPGSPLWRLADIGARSPYYSQGLMAFDERGGDSVVVARGLAPPLLMVNGGESRQGGWKLRTAVPAV